MKISKYLHSCLLVEDQGKTILLDPGTFTYNAQALDMNKLNKLDYILITHDHADHFCIPLIKELLKKFPQAAIISTPSVVTLLEKEHIKATSEANDIVKLEIVTHEKLWDKEPPQNAVFTIFDRLTHPGDSLHFATTAAILALPITAPWGSTTEAVNKALALKPKYIIPIHDWMWKDEVRMMMYDRLTEFFTTKNIQCRGTETKEAIEI